ncbi:hypothetical protein CC1G_02627 [Coprinopsis cinerea okayama7|uniref:F-box domain-containing protein n=1 Tax=Coprinopsis cinerea (strain Okayama-7 / 130 / ATCC MYA-4618 / FGSC 9003) TaxID=240176 RepID=A8PBE6_COPC7|nr:hypothetical protein CC1G_02627 [Coprinopsis cinerea okayama7\|eukprot:XP_001840164.1 hypothetical protein CC1G_02627 [Coprinopsis cinerea okayama7\
MDSIASSPFSPHLGTNYAPSDSEIAHLRDYIGDLTPHLADLEGKVEAAERALAAAAKKRDGYLQFVDNHRALLSPIRRMPLDVTRTIFQHCLPDKHNAIMSTSQAPLLLTMVCRQWREIVLNFPAMWSSLHIPVVTVPAMRFFHRSTTPPIDSWTRRMKHRNQAVTRWLNRAKGSKLSISLATDPNDESFSDEDDQEVVAELLDILKERASQLQRLKLSTTQRIANRVLSIPPSQVPELRVIHINIYNPFSDFPFPATNASSRIPANGIIASPTLRTVHVESIPQRLIELSVEWENITDLTCFPVTLDEDGGVKGFTAREAVNILGRCPNLKTCCLRIHFMPHAVPLGEPEPDMENETGRTVTLHHLETLHLQQEYRAMLEPLVDSLRLPALRSLSFSSSKFPSTKASPLIRLMRHCGPNLKTLKVDYLTLKTPELRQCLELAKNVEELDLSPEQTVRPRADTSWYGDFDMVFGDEEVLDWTAEPTMFEADLLAQLTPTEASTAVLCPRLSSFRIKLHSRDEVGCKEIKDFIRGRRRFGKPGGDIATLSKVNVIFPWREPKADGSSSSMSQDDGIDWDRFEGKLEWGKPLGAWAAIDTTTLAALQWNPAMGA